MFYRFLGNMETHKDNEFGNNTTGAQHFGENLNQTGGRSDMDTEYSTRTDAVHSTGRPRDNDAIGRPIDVSTMGDRSRVQDNFNRGERTDRNDEFDSSDRVRANEYGSSDRRDRDNFSTTDRMTDRNDHSTGTTVPSGGTFGLTGRAGGHGGIGAPDETRDRDTSRTDDGFMRPGGGRTGIGMDNDNFARSDRRDMDAGRRDDTTLDRVGQHGHEHDRTGHLGRETETERNAYGTSNEYNTSTSSSGPGGHHNTDTTPTGKVGLGDKLKGNISLHLLFYSLANTSLNHRNNGADGRQDYQKSRNGTTRYGAKGTSVALGIQF